MLYTLFFSRCISRVCNVKLLLLLIIIAIVVFVVVEEVVVVVVVVEVFVVCDGVSIGLVVVTEPPDVGTFFQLLFRRKCFSGARADVDVDVSHDASVPVVCVAVCLVKISRKVNKLNKNVRFFIEKRT